MSETQKDCRENEKHWRDHCVDVNLAEVWLERLNHLLAFNLMSICEGHHTQVRGSVGRFPHIYLKLKESYLPGFVKEWDNLRSAFMDEVHKNFQLGDTYFNLEMKTKLRAGRGRLVYQEELTLKMRAFQPRFSETMIPETQAWFENCITRLETLDKIVADWHRGKRA
jgi:hypothetical protein